MMLDAPKAIHAPDSGFGIRSTIHPSTKPPGQPDSAPPPGYAK